ncbi:MAG: ParB N-terminal domain-containing protein [Candidatus Poseidoniales archaeon]|nr:ParB N-terminal domain-containing protein [Candidatus Poseidoniales archaeon]
MSWEADDVTLVNIEWLKPHEEIKIKNRDKLLDMTKRWGGFTKPLLVDSQTGAILDGHHRYSVALSLELKRVPVILIDYLEDDEITVDVWPGCGLQSISKQDVINMCLSEELYPPKTSKHTIANHMPPIHVLLEDLSRSE